MDEYTYSNKYKLIREENLVLDYLGDNIFIDEKKQKYKYINGKLYKLVKSNDDNEKEELILVD
jgi:hypothetical protein